MIETQFQLNSAIQSGQLWWGFMRRGGPVLTANVYADLSYAAGTPVANYYASTPLTGAVLPSREGIDIGPTPAAGLQKYINKVTILPPTACGIMEFRLIDVCLYYPFIDGDGGFQEVVNTAPVSRYSNGKGCMIMVVSQGVGVGVVNAIVTYTNSAGVSGRQVTVSLNLAAAAGSLCSSHAPGTAIQYPEGPFLPLVTGDLGVQSIESVEYLAGGGGIAAFVIVRPLVAISMFEATLAPLEVDCWADRTMQLPSLDTGAYLSMIARGTTGAAPATIHALVETVWG